MNTSGKYNMGLKWRLLPLLLLIFSCQRNNKTPSKEIIYQLQLLRGNIIACGAPGQQFGNIDFVTSCSGKSKKGFNLGVALLHSFEYDEAEKAFAAVIDAEPACAMAYWGVAMSNYHQVWPSPPAPEQLKKGAAAIQLARSIAGKSQKETDYIDAIGVFYNDWTTTSHRVRSVNFCKAMESMFKKYPNDKEVAVFYALSLDGSADPADKKYVNQRTAGAILSLLYPGQPEHPGIVHYIIHSYDYPELAKLALPAAEKYASIAPSSAHALHMPSHIFTRLGLWDQCINPTCSY